MKHPIDIYVGSRLRLRRNSLGLSQKKLSKMIGVTYQQIQKYEKGADGIKTRRLYKLARILLVPISYFFEGYENHEEIQDMVAEYGLENKEIAKLVKSFIKIKDKETRKSVIAITKNITDIVKNGGSDE